MTDYKLVPVEPTPEMLEAYESASIAPVGPISKNGYKAMLAAAPALQGEPVAWMFADEMGRTKIVLGKETAESLCPSGEVTPLYTAPQPAEQQPAPDVAGLVEAAEAALSEIEDIMQEAYNSAYPVCCGRAGSECCGSPEPEWEEADQRMMDRLAPHQKALMEALAAHRKGGKV